MKKFILCIILAGCLFTGCSSGSNDVSGKNELGYKQVGAIEAMELMNTKENYIILDVRRLDEFESRHIVGAICVPNEMIGTEPIPELPEKDQLILIYCRSGNRSKQAAEKLVKMGYTNIVEFGGIIDWHGATVSGE